MEKIKVKDLPKGSIYKKGIKKNEVIVIIPTKIPFLINKRTGCQVKNGFIDWKSANYWAGVLKKKIHFEDNFEIEIDELLYRSLFGRKSCVPSYKKRKRYLNKE